jgi:nitroreductase
MEFRDVVRARHMTRRYDTRPVDPAIIDRMLLHATKAPSAGFTQGWAFLRLDLPEDVARFWRVAGSNPDATNPWLDGMRTAPVVIVPMSSMDAYLDRYAQPDKGWYDREPSRWRVPYWHMDVAMAALLILQTAVDEGLGACFFGLPEVESFRAAFGVPDTFMPIGAITVGHGLSGDRGVQGSPARRARRPLEDVIHRGHWRD